MSKYTVGIDVAKNEDYTMYCISKRPGSIVRFINHLLKRADNWKVVYCGTNPDEMRKYHYHSATVREESPNV